MFSRISTNDLLKYFAIGGFACVGMGLLYQNQMTNKVRNVQYFRDVMNIVNEHKAVDELLGKPIKSGFIDVFSSKNYADDHKVNLYVPVKGPKAKGELFFSAIKSDDQWLVKRVELEMKDKLGGKLLVFNNSQLEELKKESS